MMHVALHSAFSLFSKLFGTLASLGLLFRVKGFILQSVMNVQWEFQVTSLKRNGRFMLICTVH